MSATSSSDPSSDPSTFSVSRRGLLLGAGAATGAALLPGSHATAASPAIAGDVPQAVGAAIPGLTYVGFDAQQFWPEVASQRHYEHIIGTRLVTSGRIWAGLPLPVGSIVRQINVGYQGQPIAEISRRLITQPNPAVAPSQVFQESLPQSPGGPFASTLNLATPLTIGADSTYTLSFYLAGDASVYGATVGYLPPTQTFVPFTGPKPRVLDTRLPGPLTGKLQPNEERVVDLGFAGARSAVINLTIAETVGAGFVAVFAADIAWPENSSINWSASGGLIANGVTTAVDTNGRIKIRAGTNATHVIIDRIGFLV